MLYRSLVRAPAGIDADRATSSPQFRLEQKKQERWEEAVNCIDVWHSSPKAWNTISKLSSRSGPSSRLCPVSANSMASQLVKNVAHKTRGRESTRPTNKELCDL